MRDNPDQRRLRKSQQCSIEAVDWKRTYIESLVSDKMMSCSASQPTGYVWWYRETRYLDSM